MLELVDRIGRVGGGGVRFPQYHDISRPILMLYIVDLYYSCKNYLHFQRNEFNVYTLILHIYMGCSNVTSLKRITIYYYHRRVEVSYLKNKIRQPVILKALSYTIDVYNLNLPSHFLKVRSRKIRGVIQEAWTNKRRRLNWRGIR